MDGFCLKAFEFCLDAKASARINRIFGANDGRGIRICLLSFLNPLEFSPMAYGSWRFQHRDEYLNYYHRNSMHALKKHLRGFFNCEIIVC